MNVVHKRSFCQRLVALFLMLLLPGVFLMSQTQTVTQPETNKDAPIFIILFGAPGSGKGTQAALLASKYHFVHISTGDMFRDNIRNSTPVGLRAKEYIDRGELVPDSVVIDMIKERLKQPDCKQGVLLDGFPRNVAQARALDEVLKEYRPLVFSYDVSDATVIKRICGRRVCTGCNMVYHVIFSPPKTEGVCDVCQKPLTIRPDDTEEVVKTRLHVFHTQTAPVKEYYEKKGLLKGIDAEQSPDAIAAKSFAIIDPMTQPAPKK